MLYRAEIYAVIIFGADTWVILAEMDWKVEGTHTGFLRKTTGKRARWLPYRTWGTPGAESVQEVAVMQSELTYIGRWLSNVSKWVALRPIFKVCADKKV